MKSKNSHSNHGESYIPKVIVYEGYTKHLTKIFKSIQEVDWK